MTLRTLGILCGVLGPLIWLSLIAVAGALRPDFNHITHYISELGERGSSTEFLVGYAAFEFTGILYLGFAAALWAIFRKNAWSFALASGLLGLEGLGRIGAGVFACDPGCAGLSSTQEVHHLFATLGFSAGVLAAVVWGISLRQQGGSLGFSAYSVGSGMVALTLLLLMLWDRTPVIAPGLLEHLASGVLSLWLLVFAVRLLRVSATPPSGATRLSTTLMAPALRFLPTLVTLGLCAALVAYGPIAQPENYHDFADRAVIGGVAHFYDVLSNLGFALVGVWGWNTQSQAHRHAHRRGGRLGYRLFFAALILTAAGSSYYHLAPDNGRLLWDRLPIALACAGLLAAVRTETQQRGNGLLVTAALALLAGVSVAWWVATDRSGVGDLRPYLLLQVLPLLLVPLWQWLHRSPAQDRLYFGLALAVYVLAKLAELNDHALFAFTAGSISGHTLKHLLATGAAALIAARLQQRLRHGDAGAY